MQIRTPIFLLILTVILIFSSAQKIFAKAPPANGKHIEYYAGGTKIYEITWRKDEQVVRRKRYHKNGKLARDIAYRDGQRVWERRYHENGRLKSFWTAKTQEIRLYDRRGKFRKAISTTVKGLNVKGMPANALIFGR